MLFSSINLDASGKQQGYLQVPYSHNLGGWANVVIPMTVISNGAGPTVLVLGGNHGDEYQFNSPTDLSRRVYYVNVDNLHVDEGS